jgi:hypothetical protein
MVTIPLAGGARFGIRTEFDDRCDLLAVTGAGVE